MKYLFVSEKPSTMRAVQDVYKKHKQEIDSKLGEIEFVALAGHVCRYIEPDEYPQWKGLKWKQVDLPMIPDPFVIDQGKGEREQKIVAGVRDRLNDGTFSGIIVGTDSDTEGNGIFYLLSEYLGLQNFKTLRFFESDLTEKGILTSFSKLTDFYTNPRDIRMTEQYKCRSHFDWLVGMNATRAITVKTGTLLRIGRVKAPTLKLVYDNSKAIDEFVPHSDYLVKAFYGEGFSGYCYEDKENTMAFESPIKAQSFIDGLDTTNGATVTEISRKKETKPAPQLYKLSDLQVDAGSKYNYNPAKTLELVQSLYEKKYVSYPRTDGVYISTEKSKSFERMLTCANTLPSLSPYIHNISKDDIEKVRGNKRVVNDEEVNKSSHDALLPTDTRPDLSTLSQDEVNIYEMICRRLVAQFMPELIESKTVLWAEIDGEAFKSTGSVIVQKGWSELYDRKSNAETIPETVAKNTVLNIDRMEPYEKKSKPPKRLTTWSLISAMENIARYIDDKNLKQTMKDAKGLGTQATRATIINELISSGYIDENGKSKQLTITANGKLYIETIKDFSIVNPESAAQWETMFQEVKEGKISYDEAQRNIIKYINDFISEVNALQVTKAPNMSNAIAGLSCPYCGQPVRTLKWGYACVNSQNNGCSFKVSNYDGKLKESDVKSLINKGVTRKITGICKSAKTGQSYDARVKLNPAGSKYPTEFQFDSK